MKKASIIGLGDILKGDFGIGCYIIEALEQEQLGNSIHLAYLADDPRYAGGLLYEVDFAIIVAAVSMGGPAGGIHCWNYKTFQHNVAWLINEFHSIEFLVDALGRTELAGGFPEDLLFLWIEPKVIEGVALSKEILNAIRPTIQIIKKNLFERGFLPENALKISPIYRLELIRKVV
ncbi:MAG: hydrogenase maturation protease [Desulfobacterales bacterium]|uniref:Hydrogenase maturation protease n=1 Tax=Candidatus Desulfaltia bathyphila TaxID=2841697 RepID=A0A8J6N7A4_9BACT|nr:hydrogenase maturation protease [Candidatus Desulfaltia bathyphila]MBL7195721.1 hydrogenase maturation protease [Desulfobacterales bacterium]MBL7207016.1 hydrogenase maturation protease [Desulfobacterales bacterium]